MKIYTAKEVSALLKERPAVTLDRLSRGEIPAYREGKCTGPGRARTVIRGNECQMVLRR